MTIHDFTCDFYFRDYYALIVMAEYLKKKKQITQKEINEKMNIPKSNFRRAQMNDFIGYASIIEKIADYLGMPAKIEDSVIENLNELFSYFYTCISFSKYHEAKDYYDNIVANFSHYENTILIIPYYLAQLIYYISAVNYTNKIDYKKISEAVEVLQCFLEKMSDEHRFLFYEYMATYNGILKNMEEVNHYSRLTLYVSPNFPNLEPSAFYHISFSYSMVSDFINALIYANKALPKLEEQLNYQKAVFCRMNIATLYKKLGNIDEAKRMLRKNMVYLNFNDIPRLDQVTYLNYADCMLSDENYNEAVKYYQMIEKNITKKHDFEAIMIIYSLYKMNQYDKAKEFFNQLSSLREQNKYPIEYFSLIEFFKMYFEKAPTADIQNQYKIAEGYMPKYILRGQMIQEIAKSLMESHNSKSNKTIRSVIYNNGIYLI